MSETNNVIDPATAATILKWAVTILVAGFIAQFGKKFANYLLEKIRLYRRNKKQAGDVPSGNERNLIQSQVPESTTEYTAAEFASDKTRIKLEKKKSKNLAKKRKK